jgi:hypothetical protein
MGIIGKAIARHLRDLSGLYSIELPISLVDDIFDLVGESNVANTKRALYVVEESTIVSSDIAYTTWAELLRWRTDDDRIFVWTRGTREPDTSFQSVVKPFISSRFPGSPSGECSLQLFARLSIDEIFHQVSLDRSHAKDMFYETAYWVLGVLCRAFESTGISSGNHWSNELLKHWSQVTIELRESILQSQIKGVRLEPHHAWEILRLAGLIVPKAFVVSGGNPYERPPESILERNWSSVAQSWQKIVDDFILEEGGIELLLTAIEVRKSGADKVSSWRGLPWDLAKKVKSDELSTAPVVGSIIFSGSNSPSILQLSKPTYPISPKPAWWGVTELEIEDAINHLRSAQELTPNLDSGFIKIYGSLDWYFIDIRNGKSQLSKPRKNLSLQVTIAGLEIEFKDVWTYVVVSSDQPTTAREGTCWINPDNITITITGGKCEITNQTVSPLVSGKVRLRFDLSIQYIARFDEQAQEYVGKWNAIRNLNLTMRVNNFTSSGWDTEMRSIDASLKIVVPSVFSPTGVITSANDKSVVVPDADEEFFISANLDTDWSPRSTPNVFLKEEGRYGVAIYNGRAVIPKNDFAITHHVSSKGVALTNDGYSFGGDLNLGDGDSLLLQEDDGDWELVIIRLEEKSSSLSSGLLSTIRGLPTGFKQPSQKARTSIFGRYQDSISLALRTAKVTHHFNSLFQYIFFTHHESQTWQTHSGTFDPVCMPPIRANVTLPGIGNTPPQDVENLPEWSHFMAVLETVCEELGLFAGNDDVWLSSLNPAAISLETVQRYLKSHINLIQAAEQLSASARFWVSFPFSFLVAEGKRGAGYGQLQAILLSPLHPIRLAWSFAVALTASKAKEIERSLIGFAEGWNFPFTTFVPSQAGTQLQMVAVPVNPGNEQDFISWGALVALNSAGIAILPAVAAGFPIPWAGLTGINSKVVNTSLRDYLAIHPHLNSLEIDLRSTSELPRSYEVDQSILRLLVGEDRLNEVELLGGSVRVWDSVMRLGLPPTRDDLASIDSSGTSSGGSFEWRTYNGEVPRYADIAFVENSSVHMAITSGTASGLVGLLPIKRFSPSEIEGEGLKQNFTPEEEDLLGLAKLLTIMESPRVGSKLALHSSPQAHALGIGEGGKWEIIGAFNLDPNLLSEVVIKSAQATGRRLLWEWRPSWLASIQRSREEVSRRPYYVVGKVPNSLIKALYVKQGIDENHAYEMLRDLGKRGIGVNSLQATGGSQESAAAGLFYAIRLLIAEKNSPLLSRWSLSNDGNELFGLLPLDPIQVILEEMAGKRFVRRSDLLGIHITIDPQSSFANVCFVPIEVKHHGNSASPESLPDNRNEELARAREQLQNTTELLEIIANNLSEKSLSDNPVGSYLRLVALATLVELGLSFASAHISSVIRSNILNFLLKGNVSVGVAKSILLWFAPGSMTLSGSACIVKERNTEGFEIFIDPSVLAGLWWSSQTPQPDDEFTRNEVNLVLDAVLTCSQRNSSMDFEFARAVASVLETSIPPITDTMNEPEEIQFEEQVRDENLLAYEPVLDIPTLPEVNVAHSLITPELAFQPRALVGWKEWGTRWNVVGHMTSNIDEMVAIDLDNPKTIGIFGYMGSGKSYLLGNLIEGAAIQIKNVNQLRSPLAVVVFNYRRNATDRFELSSLTMPNTNPLDIVSLRDIYGTHPLSLNDVVVVCLPGELTESRKAEYAGLPAYELFFDPDSLSVEDWELLMGDPASNAVFARTIRHALRELRSQGQINLPDLERSTLDSIRGQSRTAAELRFDFIRAYISKEKGLDFSSLLRGGRVVIFDLRQPLFNKDDAIRFFLICSNYISRVQGEFNKLIVFDEAHEYLSDEFGEKLESRIRLMRHEGTTYIFATQDVGSIPLSIRRFLSTRFVFNLGTRENVNDLLSFAPEFKGHDLLTIPSGQCLIQDFQSSNGWFTRPRLVSIRPRITLHGGASRIFS